MMRVNTKISDGPLGHHHQQRLFFIRAVLTLSVISFWRPPSARAETKAEGKARAPKVVACESLSSSVSYPKEQLIFRLERTEEGSSDGFCDLLGVYKLQNKRERLLSRLSLPSCGRFGSCTAGPSYLGPLLKKRGARLLVFTRYTFSIYDLASKKFLGPFKPVFDEGGQDAQSGNLTFQGTTPDEQSLILYATDFGPVFFDLTKLAKVQQLTPFWSYALQDQGSERSKHTVALLNQTGSPAAFSLLISAEGQPRVLKNQRIRTKAVEHQLSAPLSLGGMEVTNFRASEQESDDSRLVVVQLKEKTLSLSQVDSDLPFLEFSPFSVEGEQQLKTQSLGSRSAPTILKTQFSPDDQSLSLSWSSLEPKVERFDYYDKSSHTWLATLVFEEENGDYLVVDLASGELSHLRPKKNTSTARLLARQLNDRGFSFYKKKKLDQAAQFFDQATQIDASFLVAWTNLASTLSLLARFDEAMSALKSAAAIDPATTLKKMNRDPDYAAMQENQGFQALKSKLSPKNP